MTGLNKAYALFLVQHQELDLCHCSNERRSSGFMHRSSHFDSIDLARCKFALEKSAFAREVGGNKDLGKSNQNAKTSHLW